MGKNEENTHRPEWRWNGRSLENYKAMHRNAVPKNREIEFLAARSLTQARKIAFGVKQKSTSCRCGQASCRRRDGKSGSSC